MEDATIPTTAPRIPGIYSGIPADDYHSGPEISVSGLKLLDVAPAKYRYGERKESAALTRGTAIHTAILEPHLLHANYFPTNIKVLDARHNAVKEEQARAGHRKLIKQDEWDMVRRVQDAVWAHPDAADLLEGALVEQSIYWIDPRTGAACRGRTDAYKPAQCTVADVKTTTDASPKGFGKAIADWSYHFQDVFYTGALELLTGQPHILRFIAVETTRPYLVAVHEVDEEARRVAVEAVTRLLDVYAECLRTDTWPGYPEGVHQCALPHWALRAA